MEAVRMQEGVVGGRKEGEGRVWNKGGGCEKGGGEE